MGKGKIETVTCNSCGDIFTNITPTLGVQPCRCGKVSCDTNGIYIRTLFESDNVEDATYKEIVLDEVEYFEASEIDKKILLATATVLKQGFAKPIELDDNFKLGKSYYDI